MKINAPSSALVALSLYSANTLAVPMFAFPSNSINAVGSVGVKTTQGNLRDIFGQLTGLFTHDHKRSEASEGPLAARDCDEDVMAYSAPSSVSTPAVATASLIPVGLMPVNGTAPGYNNTKGTPLVVVSGPPANVSKPMANAQKPAANVTRPAANITKITISVPGSKAGVRISINESSADARKIAAELLAGLIGDAKPAAIAAVESAIPAVASADLAANPYSMAPVIAVAAPVSGDEAPKVISVGPAAMPYNASAAAAAAIAAAVTSASAAYVSSAPQTSAAVSTPAVTSAHAASSAAAGEYYKRQAANLSINWDPLLIAAERPQGLSPYQSVLWDAQWSLTHSNEGTIHPAVPTSSPVSEAAVSTPATTSATTSSGAPLANWWDPLVIAVERPKSLNSAQSSSWDAAWHQTRSKYTLAPSSPSPAPWSPSPAPSTSSPPPAASSSSFQFGFIVPSQIITVPSPTFPNGLPPVTPTPQHTTTVYVFKDPMKVNKA